MVRFSCATSPNTTITTKTPTPRNGGSLPPCKAQRPPGWAASSVEQQGALCPSHYWKPTAKCPPLVLAAPFPPPAPFFGVRTQPKGMGSSCSSPIHLPKVEPGWLLPTRVPHLSGVGVSLQPPACSRWTRAPAGTTPCAGISTP